MLTIKTTGRTDLDDFWRLSGILSSRLTQTPILVFPENDGVIEVQVLDRAAKALVYPDATPAMAQWKGEWRSDFFQFTVGDLRQALAAKQ